MKIIKTIKREVYLCVSVTGLVFVCALAWGSPFIGHDSSPTSSFERTQLPQAQTQPKTSQETVRPGSGDCFALDIL